MVSVTCWVINFCTDLCPKEHFYYRKGITELSTILSMMQKFLDEQNTQVSLDSSTCSIAKTTVEVPTSMLLSHQFVLVLLSGLSDLLARQLADENHLQSTIDQISFQPN